MSRLLYFIEAGPGGPIKIGVTDDLRGRIRQLDTGCPYELRVLATFAGAEAQEAALHAKFSHLAIKGEWFASAPELMQYIAECCLAGALRGVAISEPAREYGPVADNTAMYLETLRDYLYLAAAPERFEGRQAWIRRAAESLGMTEGRAWSIFYRKARDVPAEEFDAARDWLGIARLGPDEAGRLAILNAAGNELDHLPKLADEDEIERLLAAIAAKAPAELARRHHAARRRA